MGPSFPVLQRVRQPLHGLVEALALGGAGFEDLEGSVLQRLQPQGLVDLRNIEYAWVNSVSMHVICPMAMMGLEGDLLFCRTAKKSHPSKD